MALSQRQPCSSLSVQLLEGLNPTFPPKFHSHSGTRRRLRTEQRALSSSTESGVAQNHSISPPGDLDYFTFDLEVPSTVVLRTSGTSGDTKLYLLNSEGAQINYNDDGGDGFFSLISESRLEAGTYYGYVSAFSTASKSLHTS